MKRLLIGIIMVIALAGCITTADWVKYEIYILPDGTAYRLNFRSGEIILLDSEQAKQAIKAEEAYLKAK